MAMNAAFSRSAALAASFFLSKRRLKK